MDALQSLINQEAARRGVGGAGNASALNEMFGGALKPSPLGGISATGAGIGASGKGITPKSVEVPMGVRVLESALGLIPRVGMAVKVLNAGPTADGTLDYARKMGWHQ